MRITVQKVRRSYWQARFDPHYRHVGEGRTKAEAIGNLIFFAAAADEVHAGPVVIRQLPDGEFATKPIGPT